MDPVTETRSIVVLKDVTEARLLPRASTKPTRSRSKSKKLLRCPIMITIGGLCSVVREKWW